MENEKIIPVSQPIAEVELMSDEELRNAAEFHRREAHRYSSESAKIWRLRVRMGRATDGDKQRVAELESRRAASLQPSSPQSHYERMLTIEWEATNARRHALIELKRSRELFEDEATQLWELQWLAGLKREILSGPLPEVPPSQQSEEIAREITDADDVRCNHGPMSGCARVHLTELRERIASALTNAQSRGAELQRSPKSDLGAAVTDLLNTFHGSGHGGVDTMVSAWLRGCEKCSTLASVLDRALPPAIRAAKQQ